MPNWAAQGIRYAAKTGMCPMCHKRPRARWGDNGDLRITCGQEECYRKWLPGSREIMKTEGVMPTKQEEDNDS